MSYGITCGENSSGDGREPGIGRAIAAALPAAGAAVVINYRSRREQARAVETDIRAGGGSCVTVAAGVSVASEVERLVRVAEERLGPISILVNNAGIARPQPFEQVTEQDWDDLPDRIPAGRYGSPEEVAAVVVMLAGNAYITGQTIQVNGGLYPT